MDASKVLAELDELRALRETVIAYIDELLKFLARCTPADGPEFWNDTGHAEAHLALSDALGWPSSVNHGGTCRPDTERGEWT